jgi:hypothetical protein
MESKGLRVYDNDSARYASLRLFPFCFPWSVGYSLEFALSLDSKGQDRRALSERLPL